MKLNSLDLICLSGSLAIAILYRAITGDTDTADRIGLSFMLSWAALQSFRYVLGKP